MLDYFPLLLLSSLVQQKKLKLSFIWLGILKAAAEINQVAKLDNQWLPGLVYSVIEIPQQSDVKKIAMDLRSENSYFCPVFTNGFL